MMGAIGSVDSSMIVITHTYSIYSCVSVYNGVTLIDLFQPLILHGELIKL